MNIVSVSMSQQSKANLGLSCKLLVIFNAIQIEKSYMINTMSSKIPQSIHFNQEICLIYSKIIHILTIHSRKIIL